MFKPIQKTTITHSIVQEILNSIQEGKFSVNSKLPSENQLANDFNVSRSCVREALRVLEAMGKIRVQHGQGSFVCDANFTGEESNLDDPALWLYWLKAFRAEVLDLLEVRDALESKTAYLAACNANSKDIANIKKLIQDTEKEMEKDNISYEKAFMLDCKFHECIANSSHNSFFIKLNNGIGDAIETDRKAIFLVKEQIQISMQEHKKIAAAICGKDPLKAMSFMHEHIQGVVNQIKNI
jgi:GntR family transcriptional repressor for pyruvate dehydrogenase complex